MLEYLKIFVITVLVFGLIFFYICIFKFLILELIDSIKKRELGEAFACIFIMCVFLIPFIL
uniref:Uncharacterized protein n=1 Tax=viral metagenome TaxID=1070528 RepID=A0A6C0JVV2_9ZZZZ